MKLDQIKREDGKDDFQINTIRYIFHKHSLYSDIKQMNQSRLIKGDIPLKNLYSVHSTTTNHRKEPNSRSSFYLKTQLNFSSSTNSNSVPDLLNATPCSIIVKEPKFNSI